MADSNLAPEEKSSESTEPVTPTANKVLMDFLTEKGIELRLTPPMVRQVDGGGLMIDEPQIVANFRQLNSISKN